MGAESAAKQGPGTVDLLSLCFPLDETTLREAEQAASRFVNGPWGDSIREPLGGAFNGGGAPMDPSMGMPGMETTMGMGMPGMGHWVAFPGHPTAATGAALASPGANMASTMGGTMMQFGALVPAGMVAGAPLAPAPPAGPKPQQPAVPAPTTAPSAAAPAPAAPAAPAHELWSSMVDDGPLPSAPPARAPQQEPRPTGPGEAAEGPAHPAPTSRPQAPEGGGKAAAPAAPAPSRPPESAPAQPPSQAPAAAPRLPPSAPRPASPPAEGPRAGAESPQASASTPATSSPTGRSFGQSQPKSWKDIVNKEQADAVAAASARLASSTSKEASKSSDETRKATIIDYFLLVSRHKAEGKGVTGAQLDVPSEMKKFHGLLEGGVNNISTAKYNRRGMRNEANNCYVNVVIQSLLPCSALMQLLSHCAQTNSDRPFYTGMARLCKEFHKRSDGQEPLNVLVMTQVTEIISTWQSLGAQQDAGEFLFYMLNGMHEECKWKAKSGSAEGRPEAEDGEVRAAGVHEDSPIVRIFGGLIRSSVKSQTAKAESVSVEPFNHLILDISSPSVDSVTSALEAYCGAETVNEGQATKRLQFEQLPKVLILCMKRFSYNKDTGCPQKIKKAVKYTEKLTLERGWLVDKLQPQEYQLTAVICHLGESVNGGHYNAAVRYNSEWFMYDDAIVRQMTLAEVMNQQWTAYLLVYQCHDKVDIRP